MAKGILIIFLLFGLTAPAQVINLDSIVHVPCAGDTTGAIYISVAGGAPPYTYNWSTGDTTESITDIGAGT